MTTVSLLFISVAQFTAIPDNIVLEFTAKWCPGCQQMSPIVSRLQRKGYPIQTIDVDCHRSLADRFGIKALPTFVVVRDGKEVERYVGPVSETRLKSLAMRVSQRSRLKSQGTVAPAVRQRSRDETSKKRAPESKSSLASSLIRKSKEVLTPRIKFPLFGRKTEAAESDSDQSRVVRAKFDEDNRFSRQTARVDSLDYCARIRVTDGSGINIGSGTLIDSRPGRTLVLTCGHIFRDLTNESKIEVDVFSGEQNKTYLGELVEFDLKSDVGLIAINSDSELPVSKIAADTSHVVKGSHVSSIGCSAGEMPTRQQLRVTALNRYLGPPDNIECTGVPVQGRSGGGLFDVSGQIIGICVAADPKDHRGLYCGPKAIKVFLDRCRLSGLYRRHHQDRPEFDGHPNSWDDIKGRLAAFDRKPAPAETESQAGDALPAAFRELPRLPSVAGRNNGSTTTLAATAATQSNDEPILSALANAKDAEVVCIIRPFGDPRAASRIVIINRASTKFIADLTGEIESQPQPTMAVFKNRVRPNSLSRPIQSFEVDLLNRAALHAKRARRWHAIDASQSAATQTVFESGDRVVRSTEAVVLPSEELEKSGPVRYRRSALVH